MFTNLAIVSMLVLGVMMFSGMEAALIVPEMVGIDVPGSATTKVGFALAAISLLLMSSRTNT